MNALSPSTRSLLVIVGLILIPHLVVGVFNVSWLSVLILLIFLMVTIWGIFLLETYHRIRRLSEVKANRGAAIIEIFIGVIVIIGTLFLLFLPLADDVLSVISDGSPIEQEIVVEDSSTPIFMIPFRYSSVGYLGSNRSFHSYYLRVSYKTGERYRIEYLENTRFILSAELVE